MSDIPKLISEIEVELENTYLDPHVRIWLTRVVNELKEEGWTTKPPQQKSEPGLATTTSPLDDEDTSPSTSSKGTTNRTPSAPTETGTQSEE